MSGRFSSLLCSTVLRSSLALLRPWFLWLAILVSFEVRAQDLLITEFMTESDHGILDEDGEYQDWIELYNPGSAAVALTGWHLTDDPADLTKWTFPGGSIGPHSLVVVLASGKDRTDPTGPWHTNFKLARAGEYLALVAPDGVTRPTEFSPQFPPQILGASYGFGMTLEPSYLIGEHGTGQLLVPADGHLGLDWALPGFDEAGWTSAMMPVGYERPSDGGPGPDPLAEDVTQPGDPIQPTSYNSPANEGVEMAIDNNTATKYLNLDKLNAGFTVTPQSPTTVVTGLRLTSANDAPDRDPTSFTLAGSDDGTTFTDIAQGAIPDFPARFFAVEVSFANDRSYRHYRLLFPEVRNAASAVAVQIAEVELLGYVGPPPPAFLDLITTDVEQVVFGRSPSVYARVPFTVPAGMPLDDLVLRVRYDDGFVAYLNGTPVAQANAPATLAFNSAATLDRPSAEAVRAEGFAMIGFTHLLQPGANVLAVHALNDRADSPEFLLGVELANLPVNVGAAGFFATPTPGEFNAEQSQGQVAAPVPSLPRGLYSGTVEVGLTCETEGSTIFYTTDGSEPTAMTSEVYAGPVWIGRSGPLRARAFKGGWLPSPTVTHSYLVLGDILRQDAAGAAARGFPATWGSVAADYEMDQTMIAPRGQDLYEGRYARTIWDDLRSLPSISLVMEVDDLFGPSGIYSNPESRGDAWERPVSLEIIDPTDPDGTIQVDAGVRIQGGAFRRFDLTMKKSFRVVFREAYGPTTLRYPLFGSDAADRFDNIVLRANSNDAWPWGGGNTLYIRDAFAMETARAMGMAASHTRFMHLYLNGHYWGLYNPVERPDAAFSASYHGGDKDTWDALNQDSVPDGNPDAWNRMLGVLAQDMSDNEVYQRIQGKNPDGTPNPEYENLLDVDNMIDYMILNFYIGNSDWPHRNYWVGRDRDGSLGFQFYPWDSETALGMTGLTSDRTGVGGAVARPYAAARANADFRMRFADRAHRHFSDGGALWVDPAQPAWDPEHPENNRPAARLAELAAAIESAMVGEAVRWGDQMSRGPFTPADDWAPSRDALLGSFFPQRSEIVLGQLRAAGLYPRTEAPVFSQRGGAVDVGYLLGLSAPEGTIYYTIDGSDPRQPVEVEVLSQALLVESDTPRQVLVPSTQNGGSALGDSWRAGVDGFDDSGWTSGTGGVGYDIQADYDPLIGIDVEGAMFGKNGSVLIRIPFHYDSPGQGAPNFLTLHARFDDGFAAYLNGVRIAVANAPDTPSWNSLATGANNDSAAVQFRAFDATEHLPQLRSGANLLAVQAFNVSTTSSDLLLEVELEVGEQRILGGGPVAHVYAEPLPLLDLTTIKARTLNGSEWSALSEATFVVGQPRLVIAELHYHPADPNAAELAAGFANDDDFEFVELYNAGDGSMDLRGVHFLDGVEFNFAVSAATRLAPGESVLLVQNAAAFAFRYGAAYPVAGEYTGRCSNAGERIEIADAAGRSLLAFTYGTRFPWPTTPDGQGPSLVLVDAAGDPNDAANWRASQAWGGSPGTTDGAHQLRVERTSRVGASVTLEFQARAGKAYGVRTARTLEGDWVLLQTIPPNATGGLRQVDLSWEAGKPSTFFQLVELP